MENNNKITLQTLLCLQIFLHWTLYLENVAAKKIMEKQNNTTSWKHAATPK